MSDEKFPKNVSKDTQDRIKALAANVYEKDANDLTKDEIRNVISMDMATYPKKLTVSAAGTRPTPELKFSTNNYHVSLDIDIGEAQTAIRTNLESLEDSGEILEEYLSSKSALFNLIKIKYEGTENYLRDLLDSAMTKDGCPKVGRHSS
jgi:hypothetical protein